MSTSTKTIAFFGASGGVGLAALKSSLAAGQQCIALCRTPSKLTSIFPPEQNPNLKIVKGDAHDLATVSECLRANEQSTQLVDMVVTTIGSKPTLTGGLEDPECCRKGAAILLEAISNLRDSGATGSPHIVMFSTTGISRFGRDYPLLLFPVYKWLLHVPHIDKRITEDRFVDSGLPFTIVRGSLLRTGETNKTVRVGVEDPKTGRESSAIGAFISREDAGKWVADKLILSKEKKYVNKLLMITT